MRFLFDNENMPQINVEVLDAVFDASGYAVDIRLNDVNFNLYTDNVEYTNAVLANIDAQALTIFDNFDQDITNFNTRNIATFVHAFIDSMNFDLGGFEDHLRMRKALRSNMFRRYKVVRNGNTMNQLSWDALLADIQIVVKTTMIDALLKNSQEVMAVVSSAAAPQGIIKRIVDQGFTVDEFLAGVKLLDNDKGHNPFSYIFDAQITFDRNFLKYVFGDSLPYSEAIAMEYLFTDVLGKRTYSMVEGLEFIYELKNSLKDHGQRNLKIAEFMFRQEEEERSEEDEDLIKDFEFHMIDAQHNENVRVNRYTDIEWERLGHIQTHNYYTIRNCIREVNENLRIKEILEG